MMLTAWLVIVNFLITLANETSILDDGNWIVTKNICKINVIQNFTTKYISIIG